MTIVLRSCNESRHLVFSVDQRFYISWFKLKKGACTKLFSNTWCYFHPTFPSNDNCSNPNGKSKKEEKFNLISVEKCIHVWPKNTLINFQFLLVIICNLHNIVFTHCMFYQCSFSVNISNWQLQKYCILKDTFVQQIYENTINSPNYTTCCKLFLQILINHIF